MKPRTPQTLPFGRGAWLALAIVLLCSNRPALGREPQTTIDKSQALKARVLALENEEEFLAAFALGVERLNLTVPPTETTRDEYVDALTDLVTEAYSGGQMALADDLASLLIKETNAIYGPRDYRAAAGYRLLGLIARTTRPMNEAWMALDESRCILESAGETESWEYGKWVWAMGNWYRRPSPPNSEAYIGRALEMRLELDPKPSRELAALMAWYGWTLLQLGNHVEARPYLERSRAMYTDLNLRDHSTYGTVLAAEGDLALVSGDWVTAERRHREAVRIFENSWAKRSANHKNIPLNGYQVIALAQLRQGKDVDAWQSLQKYRAGQVLRASVGSASWRVSTDADYEAIRKMYERLRDNRGSQLALKESPYVKSETWQKLIEQLELSARCARAETQYVLKHPIPDASLERLQDCLPENAAYVGWLDVKRADEMMASTGPFLNERWMYVVPRDGPLSWRQISAIKTRGDHAAYQERSHAFHVPLRRAASWRERLDDDPELAKACRALYGDIFGNSVLVLPGANRLIMEVAMHDEWIQSDPLIDPTGRYITERYAVSYSPSATVYVALSESRPRQGEQSLTVLAVGDPDYSSAPSGKVSRSTTDSRLDEVILRGAVNRDPGALAKLPQLPYSGHELDRVHALFADARILRGREASALAMERMAEADALDDYDIVHVATHALVDHTAEKCALALSRTDGNGAPGNDGLIDTPAIRMGWKLDAQLVALSACQSAGVGYDRGEPVGFAQALFQAGARCVLLSLWKADDEATSLLMSRFYENIAAYDRKRRTISYSDALAEAKNWLRTYRDEKGNRPFAHPVYWSGFVLIGVAD